MLRTDLLAFTAADAGRGLSVSAPGGDDVIHAAVPVMERFMGVHGGEDVRNQNVLGAMILLDAVPAGGAGDQVQAVENMLVIRQSISAMRLELSSEGLT